MAACDGICRDNTSSCMKGFIWIFFFLSNFIWNLDTSNVLIPQLWAILTTLHIAWNLNLKKIILESDSNTSIKLLTDGCEPTHPVALASFVYNILVWKKMWDIN